MRALDTGAKTGQLRYYRQLPDRDSVRREILKGLSQREKFVDSKFFYDETGSHLFERITRLPEYYLTRVEREILRQFRPAIAAHVGTGCVVFEPGCGNCEKFALLADALKPAAYVCWDISDAYLRQASAKLAERFHWLACHAVAADYSGGFPLPEHLPDARRIVFFPGSSIGNLEPRAAFHLLQRFRDLTGPGGGLLIGVDLRKSMEQVLPAYNDRQSVTATFNKNCLRHINALTGSQFSSEAFEHRAIFNTDEQRIELSLRSRYAHEVRIANETIGFAAGERIRTEYVYQYTVGAFAQLAARARFRLRKSWYDQQRLFSVHYLSAEPDPVILDFDPAAQEITSAQVVHEIDEGPFDIPDRRH